MEKGYTIGVWSIFISAALMVLPPAAISQSLTNDMYCEDVVEQFENIGRVHTRSRHGTVLPIYGGVPARYRGRLRCGPFSVPFAKYVVSRDKRQCLVSFRCN